MKTQISVQSLLQTPGGTTLTHVRLNALLRTPGLKEVRIAVAYARWDGLGLISDAVETFVAKGGRFETIFGANNGVTTPDALQYGLYLDTLYPNLTQARLIEDAYANATYHPKLFQFRFAKTAVAFIGSANLTGGGLSRNTELGVEVTVPIGGDFDKELHLAWAELVKSSMPVTEKRIQALVDAAALGDEKTKVETRSNKADKPYLTVSAKVAPKPLFLKALKIPQKTKKSKVLAQLGAASEKPRRLYLEVLEYETGGQNGAPGYQVQLPTATLGAFFGVGQSQSRQVRFDFPGESVTVGLTHFDNATHRVRLRPIRDIPRPAVLRFERIEPNRYAVKILPQADFAKSIAVHCPEQRQANARRWGIE
jgi:HKD family nuclease